ncbi:MAG TPA: methionyl-tRNA formyltransferase [Gemmatimonadaceae bacterium]|nr:methionyl-tRNA formyltransferase [Gemmatimonadaceae bacterium]
MRVLFWGTSSFGAPSLRALVGEGFEVAGVVTQPDRPVGRSRSRLTAPPIKEIAIADGLPVLQPESPRSAEFVQQLRALEPELSVVVAYGHLLSKELIDLPPRGTLNVHASLLPKLRGAAPIQAAIREGFIETGVTIMRMVPALDAGPIILQARTPIAEDETYGELELRLSELGALALVEALTLLELDNASERPQDDAAATYARKIERDDTRIDWREGCGVVARFIRAYDPKPGAFTTHRGSEVKLFGAEATEEAGDEGDRSAGQVLAIDERGMLVATGDGAVWVAEAHPAGKKRLTAEEWKRGRGVKVGDRLGE